MSQREKLLAGIVLLLVLGWGARSLYGRYQRAIDLRASELSDAQEELALVQHALRRGEQAVRQMEAWRERSLPDNREKADSLYKAWLLDKAKQAGLAVRNTNPAARPTPSLAFTAIGYRIEATGSLSSVASMLYEFYRSPKLHQIRMLRLDRQLGSNQLLVTLEAEALILPGAATSDKLPEGESKRLKLASLADYHKTFNERNLTSVYTPPRPAETARSDRPTSPDFDHSEQAHFSGQVSKGDGWEAWIYVRTTGEMLHVSPGDPVKVGALEGEIVAIEPRSLVLQIGDKKFRVALGESLRKCKELDADGKSASDAKPDEPKS